MTTGLHNTGEEFLLDRAFALEHDGSTAPESTVELTLFLDAATSSDDGSITGDELTDDSDIGGITTEPDTATTYDRQTLTFGNAHDDGSAPGFTIQKNASGNYEALLGDVTFDTSQITSGDETPIPVDAYAVIVEYDSDEAADGGTPAKHLFFTGDLAQEFDLNDISEFTLTGSTISIN